MAEQVEPEEGRGRTGQAVATRGRRRRPLRRDSDARRATQLQLEHVGSTSVPGLAAKPVIDIDLTVADPGREQDYVSALETIGFRLAIREPWWYGHRVLRMDEPPCNLHVFGFDSPELVRHRIFRDWLRGNPDQRDCYAAAKREAASEANAGGEHVMQYNARKQQAIREIWAGCSPPAARSGRCVPVTRWSPGRVSSTGTAPHRTS
jgi:GrpB-like predicted nucleotidyltransferase (UPF0157 family)